MATTQLEKNVSLQSTLVYCHFSALQRIMRTSTYGASPLLVSRALRSAVASFSRLEADRKVLERAHRPGP